MIANLDRLLMSPIEYLEWEEQQLFKHEYLNGEAYAMAGGTMAHNDIAVNLSAMLRNHLRGKGCKVRMSDAKVQVSKKGPYFYPDLVVTCEAEDLRSQQLISHPCIIIEILSPSTASFDRGEKFRQYRKIASLQEYVLIDADRIGVECYRLNENHKWELTGYFLDETSDSIEPINPHNLQVEFSSIDFECAIADIYEEVEFIKT